MSQVSRDSTSNVVQRQQVRVLRLPPLRAPNSAGCFQPSYLGTIDEPLLLVAAPSEPLAANDQSIAASNMRAILPLLRSPL